MIPTELARETIKENTGGHILLGPALRYDGKLGVMMIYGGDPEPQIVFVDLTCAKDIVEARGLRDQIGAALIRVALERKLRPGIVFHDCGDDEQLAHWARAAYPCEKIERVARKVLNELN